MKTNRATNWMAVGAVVLTVTMAVRTSADPATAAPPEHSFTGTITAISPQDHTLKARDFIFGRRFSLGNACTYTLLDNSAGTINNLQPGERVSIQYQNAEGVLVAGHVEQLPMRCEGVVKAIDPSARTMIVHFHGTDQTFQTADNCNVMLRGDKSGSLADIQAGDHVKVVYETPNNTPTAWEVAQTSIEFTGTLTAVDLGEKTLKAKSLFGEMRFNVADDCVIIINGKSDGQLSDLKLNDKLDIKYDTVNGVNVVNRIAPAQTPANPVAANSVPPVD